MRVLFSLITIFLSYDIYACSFRLGTVQQRYERAHSIYMGYVVAVDYEGLDKQVIKQDFSFERKGRRIYSKTNYKIRIKETLKGPEKDNIIFTHSSCVNGRAEAEKKVIVYRFKTHDLALPLDKVLYDQVTTNKFKNENAASGSNASATRSFYKHKSR